MTAFTPEKGTDFLLWGMGGTLEAPGGGGGASYEIQTFATPATSFTVNHSLGYRPGGVLITDLSGVSVLGQTITHVSDSQINIAVKPAMGVIVHLS